ncbi:MAG: hypothetical protein R3E39_23030 [Anaerolineae bacterium]
MQHRINIVWVLAVTLFMAACGGTAQIDETLPTLAQLPTLPPTQIAPTAEPPQATQTIESAAVPPQITPLPTDSSIDNPALLAPGMEVPSETPPFDVSLDVFPPLIAGELVTLRGLLTLTDSGADITDTAGTKVAVLIDSFVGGLANGKMVEMVGTVVEQAGTLVVQMATVTVLPEATLGDGTVSPLPTAGVPPLPTEGTPPLPPGSTG